MFARLALESDIPALVELGKAHAAEVLPQYAWDEDRARATFSRYLTKANPTFFVVEDKREVIGHLVGLLVDNSFTAGTTAYMDVIYVRPDKRGTRAAAHLMEAFNQWVDRLKPDETLIQALEKTSPAYLGRFLERFGYRPIGSFYQRKA